MLKFFMFFKLNLVCMKDKKIEESSKEKSNFANLLEEIEKTY